MKKTLAVVILAPVSAAALCIGGIGFVIFGGAATDDGDNTAMCNGSGPLTVTVAGTMPDEVAGYDRAALERAAAIMKMGQQHNIPARGQLVALITAMQESDLGRDTSTTKANSDGDAGIFQQRVLPGWYGTLEDVNSAAKGAELFYLGKTVDQEVPGGAGPVGYHIPGLVDVQGWQDLAPTAAAQRVQRSAYPDAYAKHEDAAREIMSALSGVNVSIDTSQPGSATCSTPGASAVTGDAQGLITVAQSTLGTPYSMGAGGWDGPTGGRQDCSGLTSYVYQKALGIHLPRDARGQWAALKSSAVSVDQIQPGDLIFEAHGRLGANVDHVAMYIGDGKQIEASHSANTTRITTARVNDSALVGIARVPANFGK